MQQITLENISFFTYLVVFVSGVIICFTPCIYPILPVLVGYIGGADIKTKREGFVRSLSYVLGLALVYSSLGAVAALSGSLFGAFQNNFWLSLFVGNVFIIMGLFMLDVFHFPQISFFKATPMRKVSSISSAFLLGAVSGLVLGPCTTPVLGVILTYVAAQGNLFLGITLLFTYALGLGVPLLILGAFVGLLKKMPKSGLWMIRIKKIFGLLLIGAGVYFLLGLR
ncbi:MAG: sulfite exporter TauE/SafE family protein [Candidatus Omnitrophica bacterium]|nr:sulfite exporter TauE/SafE family protein [Candidatus Omnitrophota bacterium]